MSSSRNHNRVILTRPAPQSQAWQTALIEAGFDVALLPLIDITLLPPPPLLPELSAYNAIFLVSRNALDGLLAWYGIDALQKAPVRWLCPGTGTAQQLVELGIASQHITCPAPDTPQDTQHLWQTLQNTHPIHPEQKILVIKGCDLGQTAQPNWLARQVQQLGAQAQELITYQRQAPNITVAQAELAISAAQDGSIWLFSSSLAVEHLHQALPEIRFQATPCIATHARIAQTAMQYGFVAHICQPQLNDIAHMLHQMQAT